MTRKTPSRTKRELEKLRRSTNSDGGTDDVPTEVTVEIGGHPPTPLDSDQFDADSEAGEADDGGDPGTEATDVDRADTDRRPAVGEAAAFESFTASLDPAGVNPSVPSDPSDPSNPSNPSNSSEGDDLPACSEAGCPNPVMGDGIRPESDRCEKCLGMPRRDWRPVVRENDDEDADREGVGGDDGGDDRGDHG